MSEPHWLVSESLRWYHDSARLVSKCTKPDYEEFKKIALSTGMGMVVMGFVGFFVKLLHIPINNILMGV
eukprot:CAMPEP_0114358622 /NCGR_PEP_ID=MMETSP0101-20121206/22430_1 /TAXON_ID=38822 ORGANISM="Pteridomonas danica, Strain PT" /NCGR_SAMPLE_ID=MMETSP0101 /ASSEMBLY_ACC=CAM_ASM_000211 /LENGTH=68 /DNA_ID=CAMNT_0001501807 /DNA_START=25 /DNA_END=231 /DNA_ORIENTATION=+